MAYQGKHTGATIDAQIGRVVDGSVVTDNTLHEVTSDDTKPVTGAAVQKGITKMTDSSVSKGSRNPVSGAAVFTAIDDAKAELRGRGYIYMGMADTTTVPDTSQGKVFYLTLEKGKFANFGDVEVVRALSTLLWDGEAWSAEPIADYPMLNLEVEWDMGNNDVPLKYSTSRAADVAREMYNMQTSARRSIETTVMLVMSSPDIDIVYRVPLSYANGSWRGVVNDRLRTYESAWLDGEENTQYIGLRCVEITLSVDASGVVAMASKVLQIQVTSEAYRDEMQGPVYVKREQSFTEDEKAQARQNIGAADENKSLSLTVLDNGNIRLSNPAGESRDFMPATPSGDPMHYAYVAAGAVWNASTGYWELNGLTDMTNADMAKTLTVANMLSNPVVGIGQYANMSFRTNVWNSGIRMSYQIHLSDSFRENTALEVLNFRTASSHFKIKPISLTYGFYNCPNLRKILGEIDVSAITQIKNTFYTPKLEVVYLDGVNGDVDVSYSPVLEKGSLLYMIQHAAPTSAITITVHADVYAWASTDAEVQAALAAQPLVTLISA